MYVRVSHSTRLCGECLALNVTVKGLGTPSTRELYVNKRNDYLHALLYLFFTTTFLEVVEGPSAKEAPGPSSAWQVEL